MNYRFRWLSYASCLLLIGTTIAVCWDRSGSVAAAPAKEAEENYRQYGIYARSAPRPKATTPVATSLPLELQPESRIALIGGTLWERAAHFGFFEALLHQQFPEHRLVLRNRAWSADTPDLQPRPENFADTEQHLKHAEVDVILAAFGFSESFAGEAGEAAFHKSLTRYTADLKRKAFNGETGPRIVLLSPIANENIPGVPAADLNNARLARYASIVRDVAAEQEVGYIDVYQPLLNAFERSESPLTINGCHLNAEGYALFSRIVFEGLFREPPPEVNEELRQLVIDKNRQDFRRFRPANTFYYTGGRSQQYGYLDFLPAMRNFDLLVANRDQCIWHVAQGKPMPKRLDHASLPPMPETDQSRGANAWMTAAAELESFKIDPRFEVNLFAGEEEFPDIAAPIQMRWDSRGRLWVSCSTTYPHVYPGQEAADKLVILEDTDGDGRADKSTVFADDLHIPLSFVFGDGGVYVSEMPHLTFLKDTDGDDRADERKIVLSGFGTEDSHHALHDFTWTPDGDLLFRESIFHHSQVETPYGPVRQQNSGWFRFDPRTQRLTSFGTYPSTNPWGVTFDDWGQHVASHPIYAAAFHSLDPPYPQQHPSPKGLRAYSGTCGHEFVDFATFPDELQGGFIKARYKPTNRIEIHRWIEGEFGYDEKYEGDLIFSSNLSFIPVDMRFGPRGALYICDWYNPIKGHAQYSLRDERRDRHSGRIWRVTTKGRPLQEPPKFAGATIAELLDLLKRPEYRYRYWAKRELRERDSAEAAVKKSLDAWVAALPASDERYRHHQIEALWTYRWIGEVNEPLLRELLSCENHHARAAAVQQLRYWHPHLKHATGLLRQAANDSKGIVRMEAAIAASYIGTPAALDAMLDVLHHPSEGHLAYAIQCALGSHTLRRHWEGNEKYDLDRLLKQAEHQNAIEEPTPSARQAQFDGQKNLKLVNISCMPERMQFTVQQFAVTTGQPVKLVFINPDATDHNLVIVKPGALAEVGMAANAMAQDPANANSDFIPESKRKKILHASPMIGPTRESLVHVMRFKAPQEPGIYPFVCTFPGHWVIMKGNMVVAEDLADVEAMLAAAQPTIVKEWTMEDFAELNIPQGEQAVMRGLQAFERAACHQCHQMDGHGTKLGPDLTESIKKYRGHKLLRQLIEPSSEINEKFQITQFLLESGQLTSGVVVKEDAEHYHLMSNLLTPEAVTPIAKANVEEHFASKVSPMPAGLLNVLTKKEILDLLAYLEAGGYQLPSHLKHKHHPHGEGH